MPHLSSNLFISQVTYSSLKSSMVPRGVILINMQASSLHQWQVISLNPNWKVLENMHFFWTFLAWIWTTLAPLYSKSHLQKDSMPFFPLTSPFITFVLGHASYAFRLFGFWCFFAFPLPFSFCYLFAANVDPPLVCFQFKDLHESIMKMGNS